MIHLKVILLLFLVAAAAAFAQDKEPYPKGGLEAIMQNVKYPKEAKKANIEGKVLVKAKIDKEGNVAEASILKSDNDLLNKAALNAVKATKFTSALKDGKAVEAEIVVPIMFKLK